jgi:hypothetical protein
MESPLNASRRFDRGFLGRNAPRLTSGLEVVMQFNEARLQIIDISGSNEWQ